MNKEINPIELFREECITEVSQQGNDLELVETSKKWLDQSIQAGWLGSAWGKNPTKKNIVLKKIQR